SAAATLVLVAGAWFGRQLLRRENSQGAQSSSVVDRSVAVLPFVDGEGNNDATAYLASGLADEVINLLGHVSGVKVAAPAAAGRLQRKGLSQRDIAKQLDVKHLVD